MVSPKGLFQSRVLDVCHMQSVCIVCLLSRLSGILLFSLLMRGREARLRTLWGLAGVIQASATYLLPSGESVETRFIIPLID